MCGAGVFIDNNDFHGNIGLKRHNGGAIVHQCIDYLYSDIGYAANQTTSSFELAERNKTAYDLTNFTYYYDDP